MFGGLFKEAHRMYLEGDLDSYKQVDSIEYAYMINYNWLKNKYNTFKIRELTKNEKQEFNKNLINESEID